MLQFLPQLTALGIVPTEMAYTSAARQRWYDRLVAGPRRIHHPALRTMVRALLHVWGRAGLARRQLQLLVTARRYDAVFIQYVLLPAWLVRRLAAQGVRLVYDFDDAVFLREPARADAIVSHAWRVVAGSHCNLAYALERNAASALVPSSVPVEQYAPDDRAGRRGMALRIGWIGSPATLHYLALLAAPLRRLRAAGISFELVIAGTRDRADLLPDFGEVPVELVPSYTAAELPSLVTSLDVGVMPLEDGPWERGKCAMKALIYMAGAVPAVCSPVGEVPYVIQDGVSGLLAGSADEWEARLLQLAHDAALRRQIGAAGRRVVLDRYSAEKCFELLRAHVFDPLLSGDAR